MQQNGAGGRQTGPPEAIPQRQPDRSTSSGTAKLRGLGSYSTVRTAGALIVAPKAQSAVTRIEALESRPNESAIR